MPALGRCALGQRPRGGGVGGGEGCGRAEDGCWRCWLADQEAGRAKRAGSGGRSGAEARSGEEALCCRAAEETEAGARLARLQRRCSSQGDAAGRVPKWSGGGGARRRWSGACLLGGRLNPSRPPRRVVPQAQGGRVQQLKAEDAPLQALTGACAARRPHWQSRWRWRWRRGAPCFGAALWRGVARRGEAWREAGRRPKAKAGAGEGKGEVRAKGRAVLRRPCHTPSSLATASWASRLSSNSTKAARGRGGLMAGAGQLRGFVDVGLRPRERRRRAGGGPEKSGWGAAGALRCAGAHQSPGACGRSRRCGDGRSGQTARGKGGHARMVALQGGGVRQRPTRGPQGAGPAGPRARAQRERGRTPGGLRGECTRWCAVLLTASSTSRSLISGGSCPM